MHYSMERVCPHYMQMFWTESMCAAYFLLVPDSSCSLFNQKLLSFSDHISEAITLTSVRGLTECLWWGQFY